MKEMIIKIPEGSTQFVRELLEKLGIELEETKSKKAKKEIAPVSPTLLFGKWKNLDLDAKTLRNNLWHRQEKF
jgi:hypothetical protein